MKSNLERKITNLVGILVGVILVVVGTGLFLWGTALPQEHEFARELLKSIGGNVVFIGLVSFLWEIFSKRAFVEETLALANMTAQLKNAGIEQVTTEYLSELQWSEWLRAPQKVEFFFTYARTWCNVNSVCLGEIVRMRNRTVHVMLPDPGNPQIVSELARRFTSTPQEVENAIKETKAFFEKLGSRSGEGTVVEIRFAPAPPLFSMYLLGDRAVFSLHSHQSRKGYVPTYVVKHGGLMFGYLEEEYSFLWNSSAVAYTNKAPVPTPPPAEVGTQSGRGG